MAGGYGIYILNTEGENCLEKARELKKEKLLIEEVAIQCDEMSSLHPSSINTVRVVSYIDKKGKTIILGAIVRVGVGNMVIDNQSTGGILFPVDISEGFICGYGVNLAGQIYFEQPDTHEMMLGFRIPKWKELTEYIKSAAAIVPSQKMVGWDICIGTNDFIIIEGNLLSGAATHQTIYKGNRELLNM